MKIMSRGDTIVEVMIAVTVLSMVIVSSLAIMSGGLSSTQRTMESTLVRQEMDSQTATLRFLHNAYIASYIPGSVPAANTPAGQWYSMVQFIKVADLRAASTFGATASNSCPNPPAGSFILNAKKATVATTYALFKQPSLYSKVVYDNTGSITESQGLWIEGIRSITRVDDSGYQRNIGYIDFHIRSCWFSIGQNAPMTLGTIVRLYDPR